MLERLKSVRYEHFERGVSAILLFGMAVVILMATSSFLRAIWPQVAGMSEPLDYSQFQNLFDKALAAIIALELAHSVYQGVLGQHGLLQVRTVALIGVLAVVRKVVLLDLDTVSGILLMGLGTAVLALGLLFALTHWVETLAPARHPARRGGKEDGPDKEASGEPTV